MKEKQFQANEAAAERDVLTILPTGYGKTVAIQALQYRVTARNTTCRIVNPLNAIILEQAALIGDSYIVDAGM